MRSFSYLFAGISALAVFLFCSISHASANSQLKASMNLARSGKYDQALKGLGPYADKHPRNKTANYYAGYCKAGLGDVVGAKEYMGRVLVAATPGSSFHTRAVTFFRQNARTFNRVSPFSCVAEGKLIRWKKSKKPLKVFVSNGWQLPSGYGQGSANANSLQKLQRQLSSNNYRRGMRACPGFIPEMRNYAIWALGQWEFVKKEGIFDYELVKDPRVADIYVFWAPTLPGKAGFTSYTFPGNIAVIEIQTKMPQSYDKQSARQIYMHIIAHEFGHAFGLQHSHNTHDLMAPSTEKIIFYVGRGVGKLPKGITENDRECLRVLYSMPTDCYLVQR